ncbi:MAG: putative metal-binding motif-containing protein, partial [Deltaproteobacteria bacterium]|nr:putative metal-binding motif-containing protein [Deltaproteobacteria bacterium]
MDPGTRSTMSIRPLARSVLLATLGLACALAAGCGGEIPGAAFGPGMDGSFPVPGDAPADGAADASVLGDASDGELLPGELPLPPVDADRDRGVELPDTPLADTQEDPPPGPPPDSDGDGTPDPLDCAPLDPRIHPDAEEVCNLLDDDCDGETDEDQGNLFCGIGECLAIVPACQAGAPGSCVPLPSTAELCNGLDDDCDGSTDEDIPDLTCGQGPCTATVPGCTDQGVPKCVPLDVAGPEVCNGVDDDCDGLTDNGLPDLGCGVGPCA